MCDHVPECVHDQTYVTNRAALSHTFHVTAASLMREARRALRAGDSRRARIYSKALDRRIELAQREAAL